MSQIQDRPLKERLHINLYHRGYEVKEFNHSLNVKGDVDEIREVVERYSEDVSVSPVSSDPRWVNVHIPMTLWE